MSAGASNDSTSMFKACDEKGRPVEFRIGDVAASRSLQQWLRSEDIHDSARRSKILRMYDGYLPYDPHKLEASGYKQGANINFHGLRGVIESRTAPVLKLAVDTLPLVELHSKTPAEDPPDMPKVIEILEDEFSTTLREDRRFIPCMAHMVREADLYGLGPVSWPSPQDYSPKALRRGQVMFPPKTPVESSEADLIMVEMDLPASYLFGLLETDQDDGWNRKALRQALVSVFVHNADTSGEAGGEQGVNVLEAAMLRWRQNRSQDVDQFKSMTVVVEYVKELTPGHKISESIRTAAPVKLPDGVPTQEGEEYLYRKAEAYDNMDSCVMWLPASAAEFEARGLRGIASLLYPIEDRSNKFLCKVIDSSEFMMAMPVQGRVPNPKDLSVTPAGPLMLMGHDITAMQFNKPSQDIQQLVGVRELFHNVAANNAAGMRGPTAAPERIYAGADRKTRDQVAMEAEAAAKVDSILSALRFTLFDALFKESWRRFSKLVLGEHSDFPRVQEFLERCEGRGLPKEIVKLAVARLEAQTNRDLAYGDASNKAAALSGMLQSFGGNFDEQGRLSMVRDIVRSQLGPRAANKYRPEVDRSQMPSDSSSFAMLENHVVRSGGVIVVGPDQLHWSHIPVHSILVQEIVEAFQQGQTQDPQQDLDLLEKVTDHIREHLEYGRMQMGMEDFAKQIEANLRSLSPIIKGMQMAAATIQKQRDAEEKRMREQQEALERKASEAELAPKMAEVEQKGQLALREQDLLHQARMAKVQNEREALMASIEAKSVAGRQSYGDTAGAQEAVERTSKMLAGVTQGSRITSGNTPQTAIAGAAPPVMSPADHMAQGEEL